MATTVKQAFAEFRDRLEPTEKQKQDASTKKDGVKDALNAKLWVDSGFLTGSYARSTMIRPPSDIDLFVVLNADKHANEYYGPSDGPDKVLEKFHSILKDAYPATPIRKDHPAVHLNFSTYGFDVVPAFVRQGGGYMILSNNRSGWIPTDPTKHAERATLYNKLTDGYFVPCVKMLKAWNRDKNYKRLTGFHLEVECTYAWPRYTGADGKTYVTKVSSFSDAIAKLLTGLSTSLSNRTQDPAELSGYIDDYLSNDARKRTIERLQSSAEDAGYALTHEQNGRMEWAVGRWCSALGENFPVYG
jgi:predicted nucleotidyltransferase